MGNNAQTQGKPVKLSERGSNAINLLSCTNFDEPGAKYDQAASCKAALDKSATNDWAVDLNRTFAGFLGKPASESFAVTKSIIELALKQPEGSPGYAYCSLANTADCKVAPLRSIEAGKAIKNEPLPTLNPARAILADRSFIFMAAATFAIDNPEAAEKMAKDFAVLKDPKTGKVAKVNPPIKDPNEASGMLKICTSNVIDAKTIDAGNCAQGGLGYGLYVAPFAKTAKSGTRSAAK